MKDTSDQNRDEWFVWCYTVLNLSLWKSGVLNGVFVSGIPGLVGLPLYPQYSNFFQYLHASVCRFDAFGRCFLFLSNVSSFFCFLMFILIISARIFCKLYFRTRICFSQSLFKALLSLQNACYITGVSSLIFRVNFCIRGSRSLNVSNWLTIVNDVPLSVCLSAGLSLLFLLLSSAYVRIKSYIYILFAKISGAFV